MVDWPVVEAMPGAAEALGALSTLSIQCVATNATESRGEQVGEALGRVGLRKYLTHFFTSGELGVTKPDPGFFQAVSERLGIPPHNLVSIGNDLWKDILPAKAVGMTTVLISQAPVSDGVSGAGREGAPDLIIAGLSDLADSVR
jgi:aminoglycoside 6'-N-acetyltransferase I